MLALVSVVLTVKTRIYNLTTRDVSRVRVLEYVITGTDVYYLENELERLTLPLEVFMAGLFPADMKPGRF